MSDEQRICFYCNGLVSFKGGKGDHFPIPKRHGGVDTVPCCGACHDMKDRYHIGAWPVEWIAAIVKDMPLMSRETKIFLAKAIGIVSDALEPLEKKYGTSNVHKG